MASEKTRYMKVYTYLKENCVGYENAISGERLCNELKIKFPQAFGEEYSKVCLQADIRKLRFSMDRKIGSSPKGYWLVTSEDSGLSFVKRLATTHMLTALRMGVSNDYFYKILNEIDINNVSNKQMKITFGKYEKDTVHTISDDLRGE